MPARIALALTMALPLAILPAIAPAPLSARVSSPPPSAALLAELPEAAAWIPSDAILTLEIAEPRALLDQLLDGEIADVVTSIPAWKVGVGSPEHRELMEGVRYLELTLGTEWRRGLAELTGGGITLAVGAKETVLLIVDADEERELERLHDVLVEIARGENRDAVTSEVHDDVEVWSFGDGEAHAIIGRRLVFSNHRRGVRAALELRAGVRTDSLAEDAGYRKAREARKATSAVEMWVNLGLLRLHPPFAAAIETSTSNPLAALFFAGIGDALRASKWLAAGLELGAEGIVIHAAMEEGGEGAGELARLVLPSSAQEGALPNLEVPRRIAAASFWRDLHRFYRAKDELFAQRTSGLIFFENMMGIFFSGRDLTDEVLAEAGAEIRFVVAEQAYDPRIGTPRVQYPGFAAVLPLRDADAFGEAVEEAWQKALGLVNFTRGQDALPGLIIDQRRHGDTDLTVARFSAAGIEKRDQLHERFNFQPTLGRTGEWLILSSSEQLACDLVDAVHADPREPATPRVDSLLHLDPPRLASILRANREHLVRHNMIEDGNSRAAAEGEIDLLLDLAALFSAIELEVGSHAGLTRGRLVASWPSSLPH